MAMREKIILVGIVHLLKLYVLLPTSMGPRVVPGPKPRSNEVGEEKERTLIACQVSESV